MMSSARGKINLSVVKRYGAGASLFVLLVALFTFDLKTPDLPAENEVANYRIKAPYDLEFVDQLEYEKDLQAAIDSVRTIYKREPEVTDRQREKLVEFLDTLRSSEPLDRLGIDSYIASGLKSYRDVDYSVVRENVLRIFDNVQKERITQGNLLDTHKKIAKQVEELRFQRRSKDIMVHLLEKAVVPNYLPDEEAMESAQESAKASVIKTKRSIRSGETIVDDGQVITRDIMQILAAYQLDSPGTSLALTGTGASLFSLILFLTAIMYLSVFNPGVLEDDDLIVLLCTLLGIAFLTLKFIPLILFQEDLTISSIVDIPFFSPYMVPLAAFPMMISILIDSKFAILINIILAAAGGMWMDAGLSFTIVNLISGTIAVYCVLQVNQRVDLTRAGMIVSLSNMLLITSLFLMSLQFSADESVWKILIRDNIWGFLNGFSCAVLVIGGLPYLEQFFSVSSSLRLNELADFNQPLLKELVLEAPGTYHHSMWVANLAEAGAKEVGANPLIVRIGSYYHDIGKLKRPLFFSENQTGIDNEHDNLTPNLSSIIIESHVKNGIEMARNNNLPDFVIDIIAQHHGTTMISFFYKQAMKDEKQKVDSEHFRYHGPKPQSKEAAVVMMADSVESAARSLPKPTRSLISTTVKKVIRDKFEDGQFNECDITLKDIDRIENVFTRMLISMYHSRVQYPDDIDSGKEEKEAAKEGKSATNEKKDAVKEEKSSTKVEKDATKEG